MAQVTVPLKSTGVAYLLFFLLGGLGAHRFYLDNIGIGISYIVVLALSIALPIPFFILLCLMWLIDLFCIPSATRSSNERLIAKYEGLLNRGHN
jgi:TM2 domain-containing membrane protein YozV